MIKLGISSQHFIIFLVSGTITFNINLILTFYIFLVVIDIFLTYAMQERVAA